MADEQNDDINIDEGDESSQASSPRGGFLNPFIIRILTIVALFLAMFIMTVVVSLVVFRCSSSGPGRTTSAPMVDTDITRAPVEHLEYLMIEEPFRQRLIDGKMIQLELSIGYKPGNKKLQQELTQIVPEIRDIIIKHLSHMKAEELSHENALDELEEALIKQINRIINTGKIDRIFFQEYTLM